MYATILFLHSWLRWLVVGLGIFAIVSAFRARASGRDYTRADDRRGLLFVVALDIQVTLGLITYLFLSPITRLGFHDPGAAMRSSVLRFFLIEHVLSMSLALTAAHVYRVRTRRATSSQDKHQRAASGALISLLCILVGIPWPFLPYARPLARTPWLNIWGFGSPSAPCAPNPSANESVDSSKAISAQTKEVFQSRCAPCHGPSGRGDGPGAANLLPRPRDFQDSSWQRGVTDQDIENIIRRGGAGVGKSPLMPPNPDLDEAQIRELRLQVRVLGD